MPPNSIFLGNLRDTREILIRRILGRAVIALDPVTSTAMACPLPTLGCIAVMPSGLLVIGPPDLIAACRDPLDHT